MNPQALAIQMGAVPSPPHQQPPRAMGGMGDGAGEVTFGYSGNIPESSYYLLLGACRLGYEPFFCSIFQMKYMSKINREQLQRALDLSLHHGAPESVRLSA